jgi:hypothetical protein
VLVARLTAPAWTPLFGRAAAVVTDGGTLAAHASLVAREYGIPAVVATGEATLRLRDGQAVTVDGGAGPSSSATDPPTASGVDAAPEGGTIVEAVRTQPTFARPVSSGVRRTRIRYRGDPTPWPRDPIAGLGLDPTRRRCRCLRPRLRSWNGCITAFPKMHHCIPKVS